MSTASAGWKSTRWETWPSPSLEAAGGWPGVCVLVTPQLSPFWPFLSAFSIRSWGQASPPAPTKHAHLVAVVHPADYESSSPPAFHGGGGAGRTKKLSAEKREFLRRCIFWSGQQMSVGGRTLSADRFPKPYLQEVSIREAAACHGGMLTGRFSQRTWSVRF